MKLTGFGFELEKLKECDFTVKECVITDTKIAMDFEDAGTPMHALLHSSDGTTYNGHFGAPLPEKAAVMEAYRYRATDGETLLLISWHRTDDGREGSSIVRLNEIWDNR